MYNTQQQLQEVGFFVLTPGLISFKSFQPKGNGFINTIRGGLFLFLVPSAPCILSVNLSFLKNTILIGKQIKFPCLKQIQYFMCVFAIYEVENTPRLEVNFTL